MKTKGIIEGGVADKKFRMAGITNTNGQNLKKIFIGDSHSDNWVKDEFPATEIVSDIRSIIHDEEIDLVIIPEPKHELDVIAEILTTGKNVRIV